MSSRKLKIDKVSVKKAQVQKVELQDRIILGANQVKKLKVGDLRLVVKPASLAFKVVKIGINMSIQLQWSVDPPGPWSKSGTIMIPFENINLPLPDIEIPGLPLAFSVDSLSQGPLLVSMEPILAANVPAILAKLVVEGIETGNIVLPTAGFTVNGLGIGSLVLRDLSLSGMRLDYTKLARVSAQGSIPIPHIGMSNINLTSVSVGTVDASGLSFSADLSLPPKTVGEGPASFTATPSGKLTINIGKFQLKDVVLSGQFGSIVLEGIDLTFDARGIRLSPIDLEQITAHEITLAED